MESRRVLFLTGNDNSLELYEWLRQRVDIKEFREKLTMDVVGEWKPDLIVSYNYNHIITKDVIDYMNGNILNLHISYLPWNRGASPNLWSFVDGTPKGITIHQVDCGLDTGKIVYQKECFFDEQKETFSSTYTYLHNQIVELFKDNWEEIRTKTYPLEEQERGGSYHSVKDLDMLKEECPFEWSDNIGEYLTRYNKYINSDGQKL